MKSSTSAIHTAIAQQETRLKETCAQRRHGLEPPPRISASNSHGRLRSSYICSGARRGGYIATLKMKVWLVFFSVLALATSAEGTEIALGSSHTCALLTGGAIKCWGQNAYGQLGDGPQTTTLTPPPSTCQGYRRRRASLWVPPTHAPCLRAARSSAGAGTTSASSGMGPPPNKPPPSSCLASRRRRASL